MSVWRNLSGGGDHTWANSKCTSCIITGVIFTVHCGPPHDWWAPPENDPITHLTGRWWWVYDRYYQEVIFQLSKSQGFCNPWIWRFSICFGCLLMFIDFLFCQYYCIFFNPLYLCLFTHDEKYLKLKESDMSKAKCHIDGWWFWLFKQTIFKLG